MAEESNPNALILLNKYNVRVAHDPRPVEYKTIVLRLTKSAPTKELFALGKDEGLPQVVMLVAVVCDEYTLMETPNCVGITLKNANDPLSTRIPYNGAWYSDVVLPGQDKHALRTVFEPPPVRMPLAREHFKDWTPEKCNKGIIYVGPREKQNTMVLCTERDFNGEAICPLGYLLHLETQGGPVYGALAQKGTYDGGEPKFYYILARENGEKILAAFQRDAQDPRPIVNTKTLTLQAYFDEKSNDAVLCMNLTVYYYTEKS